MRDHAFDLVPWSHACALFGAVLVAVVTLSPALASLACSTADSSTIAAGKPFAQGCTADVATNGALVFTEVLVVGVTPQGASLWVTYPQREPRRVNGKAYADGLPVSRFIPRGQLGHANNGRATRCPEALWGVAVEPQP